MWNDEVRWTTKQPHLSTFIHAQMSGKNKRQKDLNSFPLGELEETTRMYLYHVDYCG